MPTDQNKPKKHEAKDFFSEKVKYNRIKMVATVISKPDHQATIIRGEVRSEVTVRANLYNGNSSFTYTLRFIDKRFLPLAARLQPGCRINIENGKFRKRHGRNSLESEFEVKRFTVLAGELKSEVPRRLTNRRRRKYLRAILLPGWVIGFQEPAFSMNNLPKPKEDASGKLNARRLQEEKLIEVYFSTAALRPLFQKIWKESAASKEDWQFKRFSE